MVRRIVSYAIVFLVVGLVVGGLAGGVIGAASVTPGSALQAPTGGTQAAVGGSGTGGGGASADVAPTSAPSYAALYNRTIDSVVKVTVRTPTGVDQGSGFVYDAHHIVTNDHVVGSAQQVTVQFSGGAYRTATVSGTDPYSDLAVLSVASMPNGTRPLRVATGPPTPGQPVVALGTPFGLEGTITHGIVSGVNRSMTVKGGFTIPDTVQTDAPINPGNSGGPLLSMDGRVVGVNRATEGQGIGFAISGAVVDRVVPALIANGSYHHSFVGIRSVPVTPKIAQIDHLPSAEGLMVVGIYPNGPATGVLHPANATTVNGVQYPTGGDVIVAVDGHHVGSSQGLSSYLLLHTHPGDTVTMTVLRNGSRKRVQVTLANRPGS